MQKQGLLSPTAEYRALYVISQTQDEHALALEYETLKHRLNEMAGHSACECHPLFTRMATELLIVLPTCCEDILSLPSMMMKPYMYMGVGKPVDMRHCYDSYIQAFSIVQILRSIPTLGNVAAWEDLGVYSYLALVFLKNTGVRQETSFRCLMCISYWKKMKSCCLHWRSFWTMRAILQKAHTSSAFTGLPCIIGLNGLRK